MVGYCCAAHVEKKIINTHIYVEAQAEALVVEQALGTPVTRSLVVIPGNPDCLG